MNSVSKLLLTNLTVFSIVDLALIWNVHEKNSLNRKIFYYLYKGSLIRVRRGLFYLKDKLFNDFELANKYLTPSYISFDTVRQRAGLNFQYDSTIYLASNISKKVEVFGKTFVYRKIKDEILYNSVGIINCNNYSMASPERALLDTMYLNKKFYFDNLDQVNFDTLFDMLKIYNRKSMETQLIKLKKIKDNE